MDQGISVSADGLQLLTSIPNKMLLFPFEHVAWLVDTPLMSLVGKDPAVQYQETVAVQEGAHLKTEIPGSSHVLCYPRYRADNIW